MAAWRSAKAAAIPFGATRRLAARKPFPGTPRSKNFSPGQSAEIFRCHLRLVVDGRYCELPREVTDEVGNVLARYEYDPYGRRTLVAGTDLADFGYTGHYVHQPSGLHLALYRAYDADLGRWLNRDPIEEAGGINLYGYVGNNPVNWIDPLGLWWWDNDLIEWGLGSMLGFHGNDAMTESWTGYGEGFRDGAYAAIDGINPFGDPPENTFGLYDSDCDKLLKRSQALGALARDAALLALGAGLASRAAQAGPLQQLASAEIGPSWTGIVGTGEISNVTLALDWIGKMFGRWDQFQQWKESFE